MRTIMFLGGILGALGVLLGAFGAHALSEVIGERISTWKTAQNYHLIHSILVVVTGYLHGRTSVKSFHIAGLLLTAGIILFSGSLYLLCIVPDWRWLGPITPLGGICFITGWIMLGIGAYSLKGRDNMEPGS